MNNAISPATPTSPIPDGPMSIRAAGALLGKSHYQIMKLLADGQLRGQKVHNAAGGSTLQVFGESVRAYREINGVAGTPVTV